MRSSLGLATGLFLGLMGITLAQRGQRLELEADDEKVEVFVGPDQKSMDVHDVIQGDGYYSETQEHIESNRPLSPKVIREHIPVKAPKLQQEVDSKLIIQEPNLMLTKEDRPTEEHTSSEDTANKSPSSDPKANESSVASQGSLPVTSSH